MRSLSTWSSWELGFLVCRSLGQSENTSQYIILGLAKFPLSGNRSPYLFGHLDAILAKRKDVQARRKRPDSDIFQRFSFHLVPTYPGDETLFRSAFFQELLKPEGVIMKTLKDIQS